MVSASEKMWRAIGEVSRGSSASVEGFVTGVDHASRTAWVDVGGVVRATRWSGDAPFEGGRARVVKTGEQWWCEAAAEGHHLGSVESVSGSLATVLGDDGETYVYGFPFGASLSAGHKVAMDHAKQLVLFRVSGDPDPVRETSTPVAPAPKSFTRTFKPNNSGNWYSAGGRWDSQYAEISVTRSGFYFYGTQIADTIPDSATITAAWITLRELWDNVPGVPSQLGTHGYAARPGFAPPLSGSVAASGSGNVGLTLTMANALKNGSAYGVGFAVNTGWRRFDTYVQSGSITISWTV